MTEKRLADIALLSIENDLSNKIFLDDVLTDFGGQDKNQTTILFRLFYTTVHGVVSLINQTIII